MAAKVTITATNIVHIERAIPLQDSLNLGLFDPPGNFATPISAVWIYESSSFIGLMSVVCLHQ
jgi:hypothetical protein